MKIGRYLAAIACGMLLAACASTSTPPEAGTDGSPTALGPTNSGDAASPAKTDPLNSIHVPASIARDTGGPIDVDSGNIEWTIKPSQDIWARIRRGFRMPELEGTLVDDRTQWYAARPDYMERMIARSGKYLYHIVAELERRNMPTELALLPFVESAFNPEAVSSAKAAGMWQFIPSTGKHYNLKQNLFRDERRDVLASTDAALDYLSRLYDMFGDWHLALAAYNWGEGAVSRAIARNEARGLPTDYASLSMPNETRYYVPKLQAVKNIVNNPAIYGVNLPPIPDHPYFVTVTTSRDIDVSLAAKLANMPLEEFRALNPSFNQPVILGASNPQILLPFDNAERFQYNLNTYRGGLSSWTAVTVDGRERIESLAARLNVDADTLREVNRIPKGMRLKPGSTVMIPRNGRHNEDISLTVAESATLLMEPDVPDARRLVVKAGKRDTVSSIARRYGVTVSQVRSWNRLSGSKLVRGQSLVLHVPVKRGRTVVVQDDDDDVKVVRVSRKGGKPVVVKDKSSGRKRVVVEARPHGKSAKASTKVVSASKSPGKGTSAKPTVKAKSKAR
ncbi:membrane-bound lytic murein transglycosylase D [Cupriavidus gilardii J11]|uniref:Membrane-bound lytic murein transglycosylase D n=1 Tax=Cupriavidus gilardii J11 TaxID=936133 RepID=A0A562BNM5_9BURK|nr:transglycosylase SLT domain-containing protein [Cupriavidus gilardii]TWG86711.1 membrane-bound lytic murein transglycosylase D [Cupriavidus gilardii J11]